MSWRNVLPGPEIPVSENTDAARPARHRAATWAVVIVLAALVAGGVVVWATPLLGMRELTTVGTSDARVIDEVRSAAAIAPGTPLARIDTDMVAARVRDVAAVAEVSVRREWPGTVVVEVRGREPVATTQANGSWWLLAADGTPFLPAADKPEGLVAVDLSTPGTDDRATRAALQVLASLDPGIRADLVSMSAAADYDVHLRLSKGRTVIWGSADQAAAKNQALAAVLRQPGDTFDVSDPTLVTVVGG